MLKKILMTIVLTTALATPTLAGHCPADAKAIDHALSVLNVADDVRAQVVALKEKGMALHNSGSHADSENTLSEAMRILLNAVS